MSSAISVSHLHHEEKGFCRAVTDLLVFNQMLEDLLRFSLIKRLAEEHMLSIHRLVQVIQREKMNPDEQKRWVQCVVFAVNAMFPSNPRRGTATWPQCQRYLEQVQVCDLLTQQYELWFPQAAEVFHWAGIYFCENALYTLAEPLYQRELWIWQQLFGKTHPLLAHPLTGLANLYREQGKYEQAEQFYQHALMVRQEHLDPQHVDIAETLHELAQLRERQQQLTEALSLYQQALPLRKQALGSQHPETTQTRQRLYAILQALNRTEEGVTLEVHLERVRPLRP